MHCSTFALFRSHHITTQILLSLYENWITSAAFLRKEKETPANWIRHLIYRRVVRTTYTCVLGVSREYKIDYSMASSYGEGITSNLHVKVGHFHTCALNRVCKRTSRIACVSKAKQCGVHAMSKSLKAMDAFHRTQNWGERTHNSVHKTQARADCRRSLGPCRLQAVLDGKSMEKDVDKRSRVLLKVSGEALAGSLGFGIDPEVVENVAQEVAAAVQEGVQVAIVVGGGNFFRGESAFQRLRIDRASADYMG